MSNSCPLLADMLEMWKSRYIDMIAAQDPDYLYENNRAEYERQKQEMIKASKLYEAPTEQVLESNYYDQD